MRFILYNIRYGTGAERHRVPFLGYLRRTQRNVDQIVDFMRPLEPDLIGLVEVDAGSYRFHRRSQPEYMAEALGHYHSYRSKYKESPFSRTMPILNKQGNAFLTRNTVHNEEFHYFTSGVKRLVIELELENLTIFLVHLALSFRTRHSQLADLYHLVKDTKKPHIVAGDFNALWGDQEMRLFLGATGLQNADPAGQPTFPSRAPTRRLDFVLHSKDVETTGFDIPQVTFSDHLPLVYDFEVRG